MDAGAWLTKPLASMEEAMLSEVNRRLAASGLSTAREAWANWVACDNEYARGDRAAVEAGALDYLNTIKVVLRRS